LIIILFTFYEEHGSSKSKLSNIEHEVNKMSAKDYSFAPPITLYTDAKKFEYNLEVNSPVSVSIVYKKHVTLLDLKNDPKLNTLAAKVEAIIASKPLPTLEEITKFAQLLKEACVTGVDFMKITILNEKNETARILCAIDGQLLDDKILKLDFLIFSGDKLNGLPLKDFIIKP
jgi:hypothetical protein